MFRWLRALTRMYAYPELLFILLVNVLPIPAALVWASKAHSLTLGGFLWCLPCCTGAGVVLWLLVIFLIVWPRYRH